MKNDIFYGNSNETFYIDQFGRIWCVQSVDYTGTIQHELRDKLPADVSKCAGEDLNMPDAVFSLPDAATQEVIKQAQADAMLFVHEFGEAIDRTATDWDAEGFSNCKFGFNIKDFPETYARAWELYGDTLQTETKRLATS